MSTKIETTPRKSPEPLAESARKWDFAFLKLLGITTIIRLLFASIVGLKYEEAYYWNYSQHGGLSFYDHPPMVGWLIRICTSLGSQSELCVRMPAIICMTAVLGVLYMLTRQMFGGKTAFVTAVVASLLPAFEWYSLCILPDAPLLLFWSLGLFFGYKLITTEQRIWWIALGLCTGLGMLSKYTGALIPLAPIIVLVWKKRWSSLLCAEIVAGFVLASVLFSPVVIWNSEHNWVSFLYQGTSRFAETQGLWNNIGGSLLNQAVILSPGGLILMCWAFVAGSKRMRELPFFYLSAATWPIALILLITGSMRNVNMNWPLPLYCGLVITAGALLSENEAWKNKKLLMGLVFVPALLLSLAPLVAALIPIAALNRADDFSNWTPLGKTVTDLRMSMPNPNKTFQAGHGYQLASEMAFYTKQPGITTSANILGIPSKSYDYWIDATTLVGMDAIYAYYEEPYPDATAKDGLKWKQRVDFTPQELAAHFQSIEKADRVTTYRAGKPLRRYQIYKCYGYLGPQASAPQPGSLQPQQTSISH